MAKRSIIFLPIITSGGNASSSATIRFSEARGGMPRRQRCDGRAVVYENHAADDDLDLDKYICRADRKAEIEKADAMARY